jgi:hypothetical protein
MVGVCKAESIKSALGERGKTGSRDSDCFRHARRVRKIDFAQLDGLRLRAHQAMSRRGVPVKRIPILIEDLIKKTYVILEPRQVQEGDRKVTRNFVSVAPFLRDMSPDGRDMWWESQTQT